MGGWFRAGRTGAGGVDSGLLPLRRRGWLPAFGMALCREGLQLNHSSPDYPVTPLTRGYYYHFFGYYDKSNWDREGRYLLSLRTAPFKRYMQPEDLAVVGVLDTRRDCHFRPVSQTTAWNWQQGAQAAWLDSFEDGLCFVHNIRTIKGYASAIVHAKRPGEHRQLPLPVYAVTRDSRHALCVNFHRLRYTHSTIGYAAPVVEEPEPHPEDDGLYLMGIPGGESRLTISLDTLFRLEHDPMMDGACHWVTHVNPNPSGARVAFLHRYKSRLGDRTVHKSRLVTANLDGSDIAVLESDAPPWGEQYYLSHPHWFGNDHVMVWNGTRGRVQLHRDQSKEWRVIGPSVLKENGHFSQCPVNPDWMISDTYPGKSGHPLFLYQLSTERRVPVALFHQDPEIGGDTRCDLHPRWSRDGKAVCVDSSIANDRQMYLVDLSNGPHLRDAPSSEE